MLNKTIKKERKNKTIKRIYSENDYNSNDGMLTTVWGPSMWHYLHTMSFNYPVKPSCKERQHYYDFVMSLRYVLPCGKCRKNLFKNFRKLPLKMKHMESRDTFSRYIYDLHELINKMLNKISGLTYEMVRERYEHFRSRCVKSYKDIKRKTMKIKKHIENGCTESLYGEKSKCILKIVPQETKCDTLEIDDKCIKKPLSDILENKTHI
jgi:hypothetical protein